MKFFYEIKIPCAYIEVCVRKMKSSNFGGFFTKDCRHTPQLN